MAEPITRVTRASHAEFRYVTDDKVYRIYYCAPNAEMIRRHAAQCGLPANRISAIRRRIEPASAEAA